MALPATQDLPANYIDHCCYFSPCFYPWLFGGPPADLSSGLGASGWSFNNFYGDPYYHNGPVDEPLTGVVQSSADVPMVARFQYIGNGTPPDFLNVLVHDNGCANAFVSGSPSIDVSLLSAQVSVSDGLGLSLSTVATPAFPDPPNPLAKQPLLHLLRLPVAGGVAVVSVAAHLDVKLVNLVPYGGRDKPAGYGQAEASFAGSVSATVQQDTRAVAIGSPIEASYFPTGDEHGGSPLPAQHQRSLNGDMVVDSAVGWQTQIQPIHWTGYADLTGYADNFNNPVWEWSENGGSFIRPFGPFQGKNKHDVIFDGGSIFGNVLGQSTSVTAAVEDSPYPDPSNVNGPLGDGAIATATYTIHWHYPYENWQKSGVAFQNPSKAWHSTNSAGANGQVSIPIEPSTIDFSVAGKIGGGFAEVALATIAVVQPETDPIILGFLSVTGYGLSSINSPPPPTTVYENGTLSQFEADVETENNIASNNTNGIFLPGQARMTPDFARRVADSGNASGYFAGGSTSLPQAPQGTLDFAVTAYRLQWQQNYKGDTYDIHGYVGQSAGYLKWPGQWEYVYQWTWTGSGSPSG